MVCWDFTTTNVGLSWKQQTQAQRSMGMYVNEIVRHSFTSMFGKVELHRLAGVIASKVNEQHGSKWHCIVGAELEAGIRYWKGNCYLAQNKHPLMQVLVFQSAPVIRVSSNVTDELSSEEAARPLEQLQQEQVKDNNGLEVVESCMVDDKLEQDIICIVNSVAGKVKDKSQTATLLREILNHQFGQQWHVVSNLGKKSNTIAAVVQQHPECTFLELRGPKGNPLHVILWKHHPAARFWDFLSISRSVVSTLLVAIAFSLMLFHFLILVNCDDGESEINECATKSKTCLYSSISVLAVGIMLKLQSRHEQKVPATAAANSDRRRKEEGKMQFLAGKKVKQKEALKSSKKSNGGHGKSRP